jgi:hypothetical protein
MEMPPAVALALAYGTATGTIEEIEAPPAVALALA